MIRLIDADALKRRLIKRREEIASERRYGWEWEYNGLNCAILLTGCEAVENPIRPEPHWIPVTERLPETTDAVLTTYIVNGDRSRRYVEESSYYGNDESWSSPWDEYRIAGTRIEVIAWMPLPEPYKGVTE